MGSGGPAHDSLVAYAVEYCRRRGFEKVEVLDGHNRAHRKPVPDVVALDGTKKVAVECGRMAVGAAGLMVFDWYGSRAWLRAIEKAVETSV